MKCAECGAEFEGRADAAYCSATCRQRAHRRPVTDVTAIDVTDVTDMDGLFPAPVEAELVPKLLPLGTPCSTPGCHFTATAPDGVSPSTDGLCGFCRVGV